MKIDSLSSKRKRSLNEKVDNVVHMVSKLKVRPGAPLYEDQNGVRRGLTDESVRLGLHAFIRSIDRLEGIENVTKVYLHSIMEHELRLKLKLLIGTRGTDLMFDFSGFQLLPDIHPCFAMEDANLLENQKKRLLKVTNVLSSDELISVAVNLHPSHFKTPVESVFRPIFDDSKWESVWVKVWDFCGLQMVWETLQYVSKAHFFLASSETYLKTVHKADFTGTSVISSRYLPMRISRYPSLVDNISTLSFKSIRGLNDGSCAVLSSTFKGRNITSLEISHCPNISHKGFTYLSNTFTQINHLVLAGPSIQSESVYLLIQSSQMTLQSLALKYIKGDFSHFTVLLHLPRLKSTSITQISNQTLTQFILSVPSMQSIHFSHCDQLSIRSVPHSLSSLQCTDSSFIHPIPSLHITPILSFCNFP